MRPKILQQPDVSGAALANLKSWLGINRTSEDTLLMDLLLASLARCEETIAQAPLTKTVEELVPNIIGSHCLSSRPIKSLEQVEEVRDDGTRVQTLVQSKSLEINADGSAKFTILEHSDATNLAIQISVGLASDWASMPSALKQAVIRLAAFYFRERDQASAKQMPLPTSIAGLLQPWRELRLS